MNDTFAEGNYINRNERKEQHIYLAETPLTCMNKEINWKNNQVAYQKQKIHFSLWKG